MAFCPDIKLRYTNVEQFPFLNGVEAHYHVMSDENYQQAIEMIEEWESV